MVIDALKFSKKVALAVAVALLFMGVSVSAGNQGPAPRAFTVLFFNDVHGFLTPFKVKTDKGKVEVGGMARLAAMVKSIRSENRAEGIPTLVLLAGDILQGTPLSTVFKGEPDVDVFNAMGVDAMTVGNHEFDFGLTNFQELRKRADFPFLSANIVWKDSGKLLCAPSANFKLTDNLSVTVIGATTRLLLTTTAPDNVRRLAVLDAVGAVRQVYDREKGKGPVLLLSHSMHETDRAVAKALPGLTAIIGGHDQILMSPIRHVGPVPVMQAFEKGRYLGRADFAVDPTTGKSTLIRHAYLPVTAKIDPDPEIDALISPFYAQLDEKFKEVIGRADTFLDADRNRVRYEETNMGNLVTDIVRIHTGADIAFVNSGGLRASIDVGPIRLEDVFKTMPFANEIVLLELKGAHVKEALTRSVHGTRADEDGGFLQISGAKITIRGKNVEKVTVGPDDKPLDPDAVYTVAVPDFLAAGGDGYSVFKSKPRYNSGSPLRELIVDTIRTRGAVRANVEGRIVRLD